MVTNDIPMLFALHSSRDFGVRISTSLGVPISAHEEREREDRELVMRPLCDVRGRDVFVVQSLYGDARQSANEKLCRLLFLIGALHEASAKRITAVVPYFSYAQRCSEATSCESIAIRHVAGMFEAVVVDGILSMDVHNRASFENAFHSATTNHLGAAPLFLRHVASQLAEQELQDLVITFASTENGGETEELGEVSGKPVLVVDKRIGNGLALAHAARTCRERGATRIWAAATHGIFLGNAEKVLANAPLDSVIVTNSVTPEIRSRVFAEEKLAVLDAAPMFAEAIRCLHEGEPLMEHFNVESNSELRPILDCPHVSIDPPNDHRLSDDDNDPPPRLPFANRREAGRVLSEYLTPYRGRRDVQVLALPRGGVPVAYEVARAIDAPLDVLIVRKLGLPSQKELAMGAIASGGILIKNPHLDWVPENVLHEVAQQELREVERRERAYRSGRPAHEVADRCVILIDDGLATGSTMRAAVQAVRRKQPRKIVVAVPVGARDTVRLLRSEADEVICPAIPRTFFAIGEFYQDFTQVSDDRVQRLLADANQVDISPD